MIVLNVLLALTAFSYWYLTGNWWLATMGVLASLLLKDEWYFVVILLTAAIGYACVYYIWKNAGFYLQKEKLIEFGITFLYMTVAMLRAKFAFSG